MKGSDGVRKRFLRGQVALLLVLGAIGVGAWLKAPVPSIASTPRDSVPAGSTPHEALARPSPLPRADPGAEPPEPTSVRAPRPGTEQAFVETLAALGRKDAAALAREIDRILEGRGPLAEKVAALRVTSDRGDYGPFERIFDEREAPEELLHFSMKLLTAKASAPAPRAVLAGIAGRPPETAGGFRTAALVAVLRWGCEAEVTPLLLVAEDERSAGNREAILEALAYNPHEAVRRVADRLVLGGWSMAAGVEEAE